MVLKDHNPQRKKEIWYARIWLPTVFMFIMLAVIIWLNELLDFPNLLLGAPQTPINWREAIIEMIIVLTVGFFTVSGLIHDLRERKQTEDQLSLAYVALNSSIRGILITDSDGTISYVNPSFLNLFEYKDKTEILNKNIKDLFITEKFETSSKIKAIIEKATAQKEKLIIRRKDGTEFSVEIFSSMVSDSEGSILGRKISFTDITEQERMQDELKKYSEQLEEMVEERTLALIESEEKYRLVVENANQSIFIVQDEVIKFANPMTQELTGYSQEELAQIPFVNFIHPDDKEILLDRHHRRLKGEKVPDAYTFKSINKDGKEFYFQINAIPITWEGRLAILAFLRDVTQEKNLEIQLVQAQKMEAIGTLAGGIAHDFNNILFLITGYAEITMTDLPEESKSQKNMSQILKAAHRAKDLISQILTFTRQSDQKMRPLKIQSVINEVLKLLKATLPVTINIEQYIDKNCGAIMGDPTSIHQVIMNLCTNAYHAMRETGGVLDVRLTEITINSEDIIGNIHLEPGRYIKLAVKDTGHGIDSKITEKIFDPYFTTKPKGEGTGLGLSVVHGIIKAMNGHITVESEPEKGTLFQIYLPRIETDIPAMEEVSDEPLPRGQERILIVDDEVQVVAMMQQLLDRLGYKVTACSSSADALERFREHPDEFDLVITDTTMPYMTGPELSEKLTAIRPDIPIILCSGFNENITEEKIKAAGIQEMVMKPVSTRKIAVAIRKLIDQKNAEIS